MRSSHGLMHNLTGKAEPQIQDKILQFNSNDHNATTFGSKLLKGDSCLLKQVCTLITSRLIYNGVGSFINKILVSSRNNIFYQGHMYNDLKCYNVFIRHYIHRYNYL